VVAAERLALRMKSTDVHVDLSGIQK
jgi:hypothetical protein